MWAVKSCPFYNKLSNFIFFYWIKIDFDLVFKCIPVRKLEAIFLTGEIIDKKPLCGVISSNFTMGLDGTQTPKPEISPDSGGSTISPGSAELTVGSQAGPFSSRVLCQ